MHYNRTPLIGDRDPWSSLFINIDSPLQQYRPNPIVTICGSVALHRHDITFLTGASHCRAHAVAKMLAAAVLQGSYQYVPSLQVAKPQEEQDNQEQNNRVLWIDSVHSFYTCCSFIEDLKQHFGASNENFRLMCLDDLGTFNECDEVILCNITQAIRDFKPTLIIIDDLDHLTPECGAYRADNFYLEMREILDFYSTSLLCIGYNLIGRAKSTAGFIGKRLFPIANNVFRITNRGTTSLLQRVRAITDDGEFQFAFTINDKNFAQEVLLKPENSSAAAQYAEATTVQDVFNAVITEDEAVSPDQLVTRLNKRQTELNRLTRNRLLIADALARGVIIKDNQGYYTINPKSSPNSFLTEAHNRRLIDDYIDNLRSYNKIPNLLPDKKPNNFSYFNKRAHTTTSSHPSKTQVSP